MTTVADADGRRAAYVRHLLALAGRAGVPVAAGAAGSLTTGERAEPEHGDWPDLPPVPEPPGAALDLLDRSIAAGAAVIGIGPFTNLAAYETLRPGRLRAPTLMAGYADPPAPGLPPWGPEHDFNIQWDRRSSEIVLATRPTLATLPATLVDLGPIAPGRAPAAGRRPGRRAAGRAGSRRTGGATCGRPPTGMYCRTTCSTSSSTRRPARSHLAGPAPRSRTPPSALTPDGAVARDPAGYPVRLLTVRRRRRVQQPLARHHRVPDERPSSR